MLPYGDMLSRTHFTHQLLQYLPQKFNRHNHTGIWENDMDLCQLKIPYQAIFPEVHLVHCVQTLKSAFPGCQTAFYSHFGLPAIVYSSRIYISPALIPRWNLFRGINKPFTHLSITASFGRIWMQLCFTPDAENYLLWVFTQPWFVSG